MLFTAIGITFSFTADDAYLTARYAKNLVTYGEFVYNLGTNTTALTAPLHPLIEAILFAVIGEIILPYKILGLATVGAVILFFHYTLDKEAFVISFTLIATSPFVILWTVGGLETPIFASLLLLSTLGYLRFTSNEQTVSWYTIAAIFGLTFLSRLDSAVYLLPLGLHMCYISYHQGSLKNALMTFVSLGCIPIVWALFSFGYYGHVFPTSSKAKPVFDSILSNGGPIILDFILYSGIGVVIVVTLAYGFGRGGSILERIVAMCREWRIVFLSMLAYFVAFGYFVGGVHMMFSYRFFYPSLFILALFFGRLFGVLMEVETRGSVKNIILIVSLIILVVNITSLGVMMTTTINPVRGGEYQNVNVDEYNSEFMDELKPGIDAIQQHWDTIDTANRAMRIRSGLQYPAYKIEQAYVLNGLGSYYELKSLEGPGWKYSDYVIRHAPKSSADATIESLKSEGLQLIWRTNTTFEDTPYTIYIMYNPEPIPLGDSTKKGDSIHVYGKN